MSLVPPGAGSASWGPPPLLEGPLSDLKSEGMAANSPALSLRSLYFASSYTSRSPRPMDMTSCMETL
jgi:hypothetical protein